jgi:hypothetical protein
LLIAGILAGAPDETEHDELAGLGTRYNGSVNSRWRPASVHSRRRPRSVNSRWLSATAPSGHSTIGVTSLGLMLILLLGFVVLAGGCGTTAATHTAVVPDRPGTWQAARSPRRHPERAAPETQIPPPSTFTQPAFEIAAGPALPSLPFVVGDRFRLRARAAAVALGAGFPVGCGAENAIRSPDGSHVVFTALEGSTPVLRLLDIATGATTILRRDACDPALSHQGQIAYLRLTAYRPQSLHPIHGRVYVQDGLHGIPVRWSSLTLEPLAWAGRQLLARTVGQTRLLALTGPSSDREIPGLFADSQAGPYGYGRRVSLVAINPAGTLALLDLKEPVRGYARDEALILDLADDRLIARKLLPNSQQVMAPDGYWSGQNIITSGAVYGGFSNHPPPILIGLAFGGGRISVSFERGFGSRTRSLAPDLISEIGQPRYLSGANDLIGVWLYDAGDYRYLQCDTETLRCTSGQRYPLGGDQLTGFVSNPSRP